MIFYRIIKLVKKMKFELLEDIRKDKNLNQLEIAELINVKQPTYSAWENGTKIIPLKHLNAIANYYNVSLDYLTNLSVQNEKTNKIKNLDKKLIGNNLKKFRHNNNITQVELAKILNTTHSTLSAYESGKTLILTAFAYQICKSYKISLDWLCGRK